MIYDFFMHPLVFNSIVILLSFLIIYKAADLLIYGITRYARKLGLSDAIVGLVVLAVAASSPEIVSSLTGFLKGDAGLGFGAILGSNMVHAGLAIGLVAIIGKKVKIEPNIFTKKRFLMWISLMLPFLLCLDGELSRADGAILVIFFAAYLIRLWRMEGTLGKIKKNVKFKNIWKDAAIFLGCLVAIILSGRWLVVGSVNIARELNIPTYFIALTIIGIGTTLPDLVIELKSVKKKHASLGLGDLLGSLTIELVFFLGIVALIQPIQINLMQALNAMIWLALAITLLMIFIRKHTLTRTHGYVLVSIFIIYMTIEVIKLL
jgi:cation:H+ antiporter